MTTNILEKHVLNISISILRVGVIPAVVEHGCKTNLGLSKGQIAQGIVEGIFSREVGDVVVPDETEANVTRLNRMS